MVISSTSSPGQFHGSNVDPFGRRNKPGCNSSVYPLFGTSTPFGPPIGASAFAEQKSFSFGSSSSQFGGFQGIASTTGIGNQFRGSTVASYSATLEEDGINGRHFAGKIKSISAMPIYKDKSHEELRLEDYELHKGSTFSIQGNAYKKSKSCFSPSVSMPSSQPSFGAANGVVFGKATAALASDSSVEKPFGSTGSFSCVSPYFGSGGSIHDRNVDQAPRSPASGASIFGFKSTPTVLHSNPVHASTGSIFGVPNSPTFGPGSASSGFSTSIFGFPSASVFEGSSTSAFQVTTTPGFGIRSTPSFWSTTASAGSILSGPKRHEELRSAVNELGGRTPWSGQPSGSAWFRTSDTPANIFCCPPLPDHSSINSPFHLFKQNPSDPISQAFIAPGSTNSMAPTLSPSVNPVSPTDLYPSQSQAFIPQPTVVSSTPAFTPYLKSSSLIPLIEPMPANSWQCPAISNAFTNPSVSTFVPSKPQSTVSPSIQSISITALGPGPSILNASQPGQTAEKVNSLSTDNLSQPSQANGLTMVTEVGSQNINGQEYVSSSSVGMQSSLVVNPFATPSVTDRPNAVASIQYGISSLPVLKKLSPEKKTSLLRIQHVSLRHNRLLPAQRHNYGSSQPKVPFFCDQEDRHGPTAPLMPRENPRAWVVNSLSGQEHRPLHSYGEGKGCGDKACPSSFFKLNVKPTGVTNDAFIQEAEDLHQDAAVIEKQEADVLALMPKLPDGDYYTEPSIMELADKEMAEPGWCSRVNDFVIGRHGYGSIKFLGKTDICHLDLESIVQFNNREVIVYADDRKKPPVGQSLNKPAEVTLLNIKCIRKKTGKQYVDGPRIHSFKEMLMKKAAEQGAEFVSYDPVGGQWKFRVMHF